MSRGGIQVNAKSSAPKPAEFDAAKPRVRDRIFKTACDLFYRHGIRAVGVDTVASAARTNKMSFYRSFASKDELVAQYLREEVREGWEWWDALVAPHAGNARAQVEALFDGECGGGDRYQGSSGAARDRGVQTGAAAALPPARARHARARCGGTRGCPAAAVRGQLPHTAHLPQPAWTGRERRARGPRPDQRLHRLKGRCGACAPAAAKRGSDAAPAV